MSMDAWNRAWRAEEILAEENPPIEVPELEEAIASGMEVRIRELLAEEEPVEATEILQVRGGEWERVEASVEMTGFIVTDRRKVR